ncbi:MAG TPA: hypothetical protein VGH19_12860 [Verrucomicrobiae bacterium]
MTTAEKKSMLKWNTLLWLAAMVIPGILSISLASTKFPWQILIPLFLFGPLLASNNMLSKAIGETKDSPAK